MTAPREAEDSDSPVSLLSEVAAGFGRLIAGELRLARSEVDRALRNAKHGLAKIVVAAVATLVGMNILAGAAVDGLISAGLGAASAGLIVAFCLLGLAVGLAVSARTSLRPDRLFPHHALQGIRQDLSTMASAFSGKGRQDV